MRIEQSAVSFGSQHTASARTTREESLRAWSGDRRPNFEGARGNRGLDGPGDGRRRPSIDTSSISRAAQDAAEAAKASNDESDPKDGLEPKLRMFAALVKALTGHDVRITRLEDAPAPATADAAAAVAKAANAAPARQGWGVEYDLHETYVESETTTFEASAIVRTADGKEIAVTVSLSMSRTFVATNDLSLRLGDAVLKDPLVINFDGTAAQLTGSAFAFDLDSDGTAEQISGLKPGSGFLFVDSDGNGRPTNGNELFGARTGKGFEELARHDDDQDGWIDEDDHAYNFLKLWAKDAEGNDEVMTLEEAGVGAIALDSVATPFDLKDTATNALEGRVRSTGIYLKEDGGTGTVQQIDLAV